MLNTISLPKKNDNNNNNNNSNNNNNNENFIEKNFNKMINNENIIYDEPNKEETENETFDELKKSFHLMENKIFINQNAKDDEQSKINNLNFNFNEITKKYSENIIQDDQKKILITLNKKLQKISLYDDKNNLIGFFTIFHIAKYLGNIYDSKKQFLKDIDDKIYFQAKIIIKKFLFKLRYNKMDKYSDIIINDYTKSGFMGDIELLMNLNKLLFKYLKNQMQNDLSNVDSNNKIKIECNIKKFIFILLNYTLKLISIASNNLNDNSNPKLKETLMKYSIGIVYRINLFVQDQLKIINNKNNNIKIALETNVKIKTILKDKLDSLIGEIKNQNNLIKNK